MKHRKLRIAWSVAWEVVAVLLVALWVRSYWTATELMYLSRNWHWSVIDFDAGSVRLTQEDFQYTRHSGAGPGESFGWTYETHEGRAPNGDSPRWLWAWTDDLRGALLPAWPIAFTLGLLTAAPWIRQLRPHFSLRTLLIATTLVAVGLGLIVWAMQNP
jgi:hypothetical protein